MKLEPGKFYRTRDGKKVECVAAWTKEVNGWQATIRINDCATFYTLDGYYWADKKVNDSDIVAEWKEPRKYEAWINLYKDGMVLCFDTLDEAREANGEGLVETRKIEWEG